MGFEAQAQIQMGQGGSLCMRKLRFLTLLEEAM